MQVYKSIINILLIFVLYSCNAGGFQSLLNSEEINFYFKNKIELIHQDPNSKIFIGQDTDQVILKIQNYGKYEKVDASTFINKYIRAFGLLYKQDTLPYPGQMSRVETCDIKLKPQLKNYKNIVLLNYIASTRLFPQTCQRESGDNYAVLFFLHLNNKLLVKIEYFGKEDKVEKHLQEFLNNNLKATVF